MMSTRVLDLLIVLLMSNNDVSAVLNYYSYNSYYMLCMSTLVQMLVINIEQLSVVFSSMSGVELGMLVF